MSDAEGARAPASPPPLVSDLITSRSRDRLDDRPVELRDHRLIDLIDLIDPFKPLEPLKPG